MYRYLNPGYIDLFQNTPGSEYTQITDSTKTKTGIGFTNPLVDMKFPAIPSGTKELWIKLDFWTNSSDFLFLLKILSSTTYCQFGRFSTSWGGSYNKEVYINGSSRSLSYSQTANSIATYLFHIKSDASDGIFECWQDSTKLFEYTGNILKGEDILEASCATVTIRTFCISNIIVSDTAIDITERVMAVPCNITTDMTDNGDGTYTATALNQYLRFGIDNSIATTLASGTKITGASLAARSAIRDGEGIETLEAYDGTTLLGSDSIPTTEKTGASVGVTLDNTVSQFLTHNYELRAK